MSNVPMTMPELMLSEQYHPFAASSSFVELDDGRIFHASKQVCNWSEDGGLTWSENRWMKDTDGNDLHCGGSALVRLSGHNEVGMVSTRRGLPLPKASYAIRPVQSTVGFWRSTDGGETWSPAQQVTPPEEPVSCMTDSLVRLASGRIIIPVYSCIGQGETGPEDRLIPTTGRLICNQFTGVAGHQYDPRFSYAFVVYSDDEGRNWHRNRDGELFILNDWNASYSYVNEGTIAEVTPGRLLMHFRTGVGRLFRSWSDDQGETWCRPQPSPLASSTSTPALRRLPNGHILAVWDQDSDEEIRSGINQCRLSSAISRDGGRVWEFFQNVEAISEVTRVEPGPIRPVRQEEAYYPAGRGAVERDPNIIVDADERIHVKSPSILVMSDRVLIAYPYTKYGEHPTRAQIVFHADGHGYTDKTNGKFVCQKLKILPLKWFYGGREPADNPFLKIAYEPARP